MIFNSCYKTSKYSSVMDTHKMDMISIPLANAPNMPSRAHQRSDFNFTFHFTVLILIRLSLFLHPLSMDFTVDVPAPPHSLRHRDIHPECGLQCRWQRVVFILRLFSPSATENSTFFFFYFFFNMLNKNTLFNGTEN